MKELYRVFAGIKKISPGEYAYAVAVLHDDQFDQMETVVADVKGFPDGFHRAALLALIDACKYIVTNRHGKKRAVLHYHTKCDNLAFEWGVEYKEDGSFSHQTKDIDLWQTVAAYVAHQKIDLSVYGNDAVMTGMTGSIGCIL